MPDITGQLTTALGKAFAKLPATMGVASAAEIRAAPRPRLTVLSGFSQPRFTLTFTLPGRRYAQRITTHARAVVPRGPHIDSPPY